jgi:hypothetical protein
MNQQLRGTLMVVMMSALAGLLAACKDDGPPKGEAAGPEIEKPAAAIPKPAAVVAQAPDTANPAALKAGMDAMQPRASNFVEAYSKIELLPTSRYFMHPTMEKVASVEFDVTGLASLKLSPYVGDLGQSPECISPTAGVVRLSWSLGNAKPVELMVDRTYQGAVDVNIGNATRFKLAVDNGNDEITCDWFSVGFLDVVAK